MAAMNYFYGIRKGLSQGFIAPHAHYAKMDKEQIMQDPRLVINSVDDNGHLFMVSSKEKA